MTDTPRLLTDMAELTNVLRAMDEWESAGGDLDSVHGRRRFVDDLGDEAADELAGLALTNLLRAVLDERAVMAEPVIVEPVIVEPVMAEPVVAARSRTLGDGAFPAPRDGGVRLRHAYRRAVAV